MIIYGPDGKPANVNAQGHLETEAITHSAEHYANHVTKKAFQVPFAVDPDAAGDCFFYLKNKDIQVMMIEGFSYMSSAAEEIIVKIANTGTAVLTAGAIQTPANCNSGSANPADVDCWSNTGDGAVDITGMDGTGREIDRLWITALADKKWHNFEMDVILPQNQIFSLWCVGGDTNIRGTVVFYYHS